MKLPREEALFSMIISASTFPPTPSFPPHECHRFPPPAGHHHIHGVAPGTTPVSHPDVHPQAQTAHSEGSLAFPSSPSSPSPRPWSAPDSQPLSAACSYRQVPSFSPAIKAGGGAARSHREPRSCAMLQATGKLCCGIAHDHLPGKPPSPPLRPGGKRAGEEMLRLHLTGAPSELSCPCIYFPPASCCVQGSLGLSCK